MSIKGEDLEYTRTQLEERMADHYDKGFQDGLKAFAKFMYESEFSEAARVAKGISQQLIDGRFHNSLYGVNQDGNEAQKETR